MKEILVSIIVPVYNVDKYLDECIQSLVNQTLKNIEIILVDDGSTDESGIICDQYAKYDSRVKVIHQQNGGQSMARNAGVKIANGKYLLFVDSDDYILTEACEKLIYYATVSNADLVWGDPLNGWDPDRAKRFPSCEKNALGTQLLKEALDNNAYDIVPWLKLIRRDAYKKFEMKFLEGVFYEDQEFTLKLHCAPTLTMYRVGYPFYYYRTGREGSTTTVHNLKKGTDFIKVIKQMINDVKSAEIDDITKEYARSVVAMAVYHLSAIYVYMKKEDRKEIKILLDDEIRKAALCTSQLTNRMKLQNRLFVYCPNVLIAIFKIWSMKFETK
ncbi:MAG: glycosyltransferase family 2 protein [Thomasclavelia sp.]|uniref:glycosyltransferase family 2 protein n=1 Tax=Thomasclavelia sp. TaxID=3025757 RepID=UPI0039956505